MEKLFAPALCEERLQRKNAERERDWYKENFNLADAARKKLETELKKEIAAARKREDALRREILKIANVRVAPVETLISEPLPEKPELLDKEAEEYLWELAESFCRQHQDIYTQADVDTKYREFLKNPQYWLQ